MNCKSIYTALSGLLMLLPGSLAAKNLEVVSISHGTTAASMNVRVTDPDEYAIASVSGRTYHMPTGHYTESTDYHTVGDNFIVANLDYQPGNDYFYCLVVTFEDGTTLETDCVNETMTEGAVWLTDIPVSSQTNGLTVGMDQCANGKPLQIHANSTFGRGLQVPCPGEVTFNTARQNAYGVPFTYAKFTIGLQCYADDGTNSTAKCRIIYKQNGAETSSKGTIFACSNPARGSNTYYWDQTQSNNNGINSAGLKMMMENGCTGKEDDKYGILGAPRLYYPIPESTKEPQTVTFDNLNTTIYPENPEVQLGAYASGNTPLYFSIIQGKELATLDENNTLRPIEGKRGEIVVQAFTPGNDDYAPALATYTFTFNFGPTVQYLYTLHHSENPSTHTIYLYIEPQNQPLEKLTIDIYDNAKSFTLLKSLDLTTGLEQYATYLDHVYAIPVVDSGIGAPVHRLTYKFAGEEEVSGQLSESGEEFMYMSDIPGVTVTTGWGSATTNTGYNNLGRLANTAYDYSKGFGLHAPGYVETPASFSLAPFYRFKVDVGGQDAHNPSRGRVSFTLYNGSGVAQLQTGNTDWQNYFEWDYTLQNTSAGKTVKIQVGNGGDGNTNDVVSIGAPRFYYIMSDSREPQTINWQTEAAVNNYRAFRVPLQGSSSSGLPLIYRVVSGAEYATIENDTILSFTALPKETATIRVEAIQPGNKHYMAAEPQSCTYTLSRSVTVGRDERLELDGGSDINELIIYADATSSGQVVVTQGVANIRRMLLKYTFEPGKWAHIAFPADFDLNAISNLQAKGFSYATTEGKNGTFTLREYGTRQRADDPTSPWITPLLPEVKGGKGYIMKLESDDETPIEITFAMDNVALDFTNKLQIFYLTVDMSECEPATNHTVYIRPTKVSGNTLRVDMRYTPSDYSTVPLNYGKALEAMRVMPARDTRALRLTLPDRTPARVAIFDKKGKKLLKAINYVAPQKIDVSDLKHATYRMVVIYGPASRELLINI